MPPNRNVLWWHLVAIVAVSVAFESLFIHHGVAWLFDEGWPLYAAMQLHAGGSLYRDVFFVFSPGHLFPAWVAYALDPPGVVLARVFYAAFCVALNVAIYFLGRRITTPTFALLAALLLAIAAPRSHLSQLLFGYRYWVFPALALLALEARLRSSDAAGARRWMLVSGFLTGLTLVFRMTPAFSVACGVGIALLAGVRDWPSRLRDGLAYTLGLSAAAFPAIAWLAAGAGFESLWREVVVRPVVMTEMQSLAFPAFDWLPQSADRGDVYRWFVAALFRVVPVLYAAYAVGLAVLWLRAWREARAFAHPLLLALVVAGSVYLLRATGRSDDHHLMSTLPPNCLLIAHGVGALAGRLPRAAAPWIAALVLGLWGYGMNVDSYLPEENRGQVPVRSIPGEVRVVRPADARRVDAVVAWVRRETSPDDVVLDATASPLLHPLMDRRGPGFVDVVSPGVFLTPEEEEAFVERLRARPPAVVLWSEADFDSRPDRGVEVFAPRLSAFVRERYREEVAIDRYRILRLRPPEEDGR
jgi:hypothetical protein